MKHRPSIQSCTDAGPLEGSVMRVRRPFRRSVVGPPGLPGRHRAEGAPDALILPQWLGCRCTSRAPERRHYPAATWPQEHLRKARELPPNSPSPAFTDRLHAPSARVTLGDPGVGTGLHTRERPQPSARSAPVTATSYRLGVYATHLFAGLPAGCKVKFTNKQPGSLQTPLHERPATSRPLLTPPEHK